MQCHEFRHFAEQWMEGERPGKALVHLRECPRCLAFIDDLEAIRTAASELAEDVAPPRRLWTALRAQLESEGLIHRPSWGEQLASLFHGPLRPTLARAYLALLVAAAVLIIRPYRAHTDRKAWAESNERSITSLEKQLSAEQHAVSSPHEHNPAVKASLQQNLAIVDKSIALCEKTVREDPEDEMVRDYLYGAYQQKADLLATMAERGSATQ